MPITFSAGYTFTASELVTPIKLNTAQTGLVLNCATGKLIGRTTAGTGTVEEITPGSSLVFSAGALNTIQDIRTSASPTFAGLTWTGTFYAGDTSSSQIFRVRGGGSGTADGAAVYIDNGGTVTGCFGNKSQILGTAYDATTLIYSLNGFQVTTGGTTARLTITSAGDSTFTGIAAVGSGIAPGGVVMRVISTTGDRLRIASLAAGSGATIDVTDSGETTTARPLTIGGSNGTVNIVGTTVVITSTGIAVSGSLTLGTALAVAQGGTGATSANAARTALGLAIGTDVQAYSSALATYAGIAPSANVQTLLGAASFSAFRTSLGVAIGTDVQAYDADLSALAALSGTNTIYYRSGANTWSAVTIGSGLSFSGGTLSATGGGSIGGSTGSTDNCILRADGTGGSTIQATGIAIDDTDNITGVATIDVGTGGYKVSGTKVVGARGASVSSFGPTGTYATDASNIATAINTIISRLQAHGLIS